MQASAAFTQHATEPSVQRPLTRVHAGFWCAALFLGALQAFVARNLMNSDGISYLDMGEAFFHGNPRAILNGLWSPLYPFLIGLAAAVIHPTPYWEFAVVHLLNYFIYAGALAAFAYLVRELVADVESRGAGLPAWVILTVGYSVFTWASLCLIDLGKVSPDLSVTAFLYLATALLLRIRRLGGSWASYVALGLIGGVGFLAKAAFMSAGMLALLLSVAAASHWRKGLVRAALGGIVMVLVISPYAVAMSRAAGRFTIGSSGWLNYAWHVNRVPMYHWHGEIPGNGTPKHPTRQIFADPPVYEFAKPIGGTYPIWFNLAYWYEGLRPAYRLKDELFQIYSCTSLYLELFLGIQSGLLIGVAVLLFHDGQVRQAGRAVLRQWPVLVIAAAGLLMYLIIYIEPRYIAGYIVLLWIGLLSAARVQSLSARRLAATAGIAMSALLMVRTATTRLGPTVQNLAEFARGRAAQSHSYWQIAEHLRTMGVRPGDQFAIIKTSSDAYYWARVARVRVIAELPGTGAAAFWSAPEETKTGVMRAFASAGAKAVLASNIPQNAVEGWQKLGGTGYWIHFLE
jgi:4-amino-4-deoxy-L-arabinose transferase-like glycosyltransferase